MTELSVIVPTRDATGDIDARSSLDPDPDIDYEVIVRDDPIVTSARNEGIKRASAEKLVFLDDDSRPCDGYLSRVRDVLEREAAVAGKTVHPGDDVFAKRLTDHYDFGETSRYVTRFWGCNMAVRKEVFDHVGLWDERISWGHEEKELAERVLAKYPIYYDPELVVYHSYAESLRDYWRKQYRLETQTPYYWDKRGVSESQQWFKIAQFSLDPTNYVGVSPAHAAARFGGTLGATLGRIRGMVAKSVSRE
ncbi:family 2 glycosyl transferase [Natrinema saccharevitans]|uniref:Family 2 glycosyl transferase n=1 Tax=Natrinema saccharevitans TaxID=301967 RepID=A0A1S8ARS7_9EURY|nr:glycosyltransferase [Natrinema saccharevitans]OLZ39513.1 family 2 glycosyl transferase [Natrinema saccharevitans]